MNLGDATLHLKGDSSNLDSKMGKLTSGITSAFKVATGVIATATTAVTAFVGASIKGFAEFEQLEGGLVSLFGEGSEEMNKIIASSENAYKSLTMSQNEYLNAFETAYPLVNAGLGKNKDAIEYTNKVLQLSSDLFNTYGGSAENYQNAINWALKGTFSYLDNLNLGIKGTQEGFIEAANSSGVLKRNVKDVKDLTNDEIIDVIQHYAEAYGVWGKTAAEAGETIQGSLNMVKSSWSNFVVGFSKDGADMEKLTEELIDSAITFLGNLLPVIQRALESIAKALPKVMKKISSILPGLIKEILPSLIQGAVNLIQGLVDALPDLMPTLFNGILQAFQGLSKMIPQIVEGIIKGTMTIAQELAKVLPTMIPQLVEALLNAFLTYLENVDQMVDTGIQLVMGLIDGIINAIPILIEKLPEIIEKVITALLTNIPKIIEAGFTLIVKLGEGLIKAIPQLISKIPQILGAIINGLKNGLGAIFNIGKDLIVGLWNGIKSVVGWIIGKIKSFAGSVIKAIKGIFGVHSPSTEFEFIGRMNMLGLKKGMEGMQSEVQGTIDSMFNLQPNIASEMSSLYTPQTIVNVENNMEIDPLGQVVNKVKTFSGGAKNDYNWGAGV